VTSKLSGIRGMIWVVAGGCILAALIAKFVYHDSLAGGGMLAVGVVFGAVGGGLARGMGSSGHS
jgi:hypothetical protein